MSYETETGFDIVVTDIKIFPFKDNVGHIRALVNIALNDAIIIRGLRIMKSDNGLFVSYPVDPIGTDYHSIVVPVTRELREYIENEVLKQYNKEYRGTVGRRKVSEEELNEFKQSQDKGDVADGFNSSFIRNKD